MKKIGILTAGGDTPALNATIYGAVQQACEHGVEVIGIMKGFSGLLDPRIPHLRLNPLGTVIPELDPCLGGTLLGASRTYIDESQTEELKQIARSLERIGIEGLICIGGDGTINGMQPLSDYFPCVLAPKTIDNDLGLNYIDEPNEWVLEPNGEHDKPVYSKLPGRNEIALDEIINYVTPGYATAVFVCAQGVQRIRTTAESHRRIGIIEVMGRQSGYLALGSAYGQPDIILLPETCIDVPRLVERVAALYTLQKHVVIVVGEGIRDAAGSPLGDTRSSVDPAGNILYSGAAEELKHLLMQQLGDDFFRKNNRHRNAHEAIFTRKVGHTQRGGRPILFDRSCASQLGGKALELLIDSQNNTVATLQWTEDNGLTVDSIAANKLRDRWCEIHPREVHPSFYDAQRFQPSRLGIEYLRPIFTHAIGTDDMEFIRTDLFRSGNLFTRYQSINVDIQKRIQYLTPE
ncbi:MAG: 6-phosphofructokinase [Planctomycetaceae bacterium]